MSIAPVGPRQKSEATAPRFWDGAAWVGIDELRRKRPNRTWRVCVAIAGGVSLLVGAMWWLGGHGQPGADQAEVACEQIVAETVGAYRASFASTATGSGPWAVRGVMEVGGDRVPYSCSVEVQGGALVATVHEGLPSFP